jgi:hypothetical protein
MTIELSPLIMGALGGIGSWFLTQGVTEPLRRFFEMRRDIIEHLLDTMNVPATHDATTGEPTKRNVSDQDLARLREAERKCRQLGTNTQAAYLLLRREVLDALAKPTEIARPLACPFFGPRGIPLKPV